MYNVVYICFRVQIFFGDFMQCPPVLDEAVYLVNLRKKSAIEQFGYNAYLQLRRIFYLVEPVRQAIGSTFTGPLANARKGQVSIRGRKCCIGAGKKWAQMFNEVRKIEAEAKAQLDVFADDTEVAFQESMNWLVSHGAQLGARTRNAGLTECMDQWRTSLASIPWNL